MKKKLQSLLLALCLVMALVPMTAFAAGTTDSWDGTADTSWYDENETEFHLQTAEQLAGMAKLINDDTAYFKDKSSTDFLIILASLRKCRNCLEYQAFPAFCVSEDTPHIMAYRSLIWRSKVVKP